MVVLERKQAVRLLLFAVITAAMVWYVLSKRDDFYRAAAPTEVPAAVVPAAAPPGLSRSPQERDYFSEMKLERDRVRAQQAETLQALAQDSKADAASRQAAANRLVALSESYTRQSDIEGLLRAKGYADSVVFLHPEHAEVVVKTTAELRPHELQAIVDIVRRSTGLKVENISVIPKP